MLHSGEFENPFADPRRDVSKFEGRRWDHASYDSFRGKGELLPGLHTIAHNQLDIDVYYEPAGSDTTVAIFHAALSRPDAPLPMFTGARVTQDGPVNRIYVSDPGLYSDPSLTLAWYAGASELPLQKILPGIIHKLVDAAGGSRLMFFGASGGGFAAMYYSRLFPESLAVAINPQTILREFPSYTLRQYTQAAFPGIPQADVLDRAICSDLRRPYAESFPNHVLYVQNTQDDHMEKHLAPFWEAVRGNDRLHVKLGDWGDGHVPPPADEIREIIASITAQPGPWGKALDAAGYKSEVSMTA
ncbi:hypothetical protein [Arthrobacter sp. ok362]|uniref:hypothetical protein n=1 Tax=Arthrobacter sp. ok362 TaxID=1761745 RepID=UPI000887B6AB|nr:hypothetical protein [Arthrobacter sp. ok362]SDK78674.1 hypothetical protein SAMN04487913_103179 [Arthrobacter sp. ok362]